LTASHRIEIRDGVYLYEKSVMRELTKRYASVEEYLAGQPDDTRETLEKLRQIIKRAAPQAVERISYNMPAYDLKGMLVYFAGRKDHIGFYPTGSGVKAFEKELGEYKHSKGAIRFPLDRPMPKTLLTKIVKYRLKENLEKAGRKT
jgi:uncharacterized protein YdhG (YjbR/CyaY superfamily)